MDILLMYAKGDKYVEENMHMENVVAMLQLNQKRQVNKEEYLITTSDIILKLDRKSLAFLD